MSWLLVALLSCFVGGPSADCMIVEFTTDNCGPCQQLQPALEKLRGEGWIVRTVNATREPLMIKKFAVESVPTLVLICGGKEVDRIVGAAPYEKIIPRLAKLLLTANAAQTLPAASKADANVALQTRSNPAASAEQWPAAAPKQAVAPNSELTVRGQSPSSGAFPMLAAVSNTALASAPTSQSIAEKFNSPTNLLASTPASVPSHEPMSPIAASNAVTEPNPFALASSKSPAATQPLSATFPEPAAVRAPDLIPSSPALQMPAAQMPAAQPMAASPAAKNAAPLSFQAAIARAEAATVRIRVDEENSTAYGTGTVVDVHGDEALVLTCGHLFREMKRHSQLTIDLFPGRGQPVNVEAKLIDFTADAGDVDIGLISFKLPYAIEPVPLLPQSDALSVGQSAFSFGCDHGENPTRRDTRVKSINRYMGAPNVEIDGAPAVGRSGGGLFDQQGRLIGVCNAADAEGNEGIYAAAQVVYAQINRLGLGHLFNANPTMQTTDVQLASSTTPVQALQPAASHAGASQLAVSQPMPSAAGVSDSQITCIIRDASGKEQVVRVASPSSDLLDAIYRQAAGGPR